MNDSVIIRNELVIQGTRIGVWDWNIQTGETYFDERWAEIIGYTLAEIQPISIQTWIKFAHPDDLQESNRLLNEHFEGKTEYYDFQSRMKHKDGHWVWVHDRGKVFVWDEAGKPVRMCGSHIEITEQKHLEINLKKALLEREILLREVHHRVKNNLQILLSISRLRSKKGFIRNADLEEAIRSIAISYEAIYKSESIEKLQIRKYLYQIVEPLINRQNIRFECEHFEFVSSIDFLVPLGLIITELVNNSIKHAFRLTDSKLIKIAFNRLPEHLEIFYQDSGTGYQLEILESKDSNNMFGLSIIRGLAQQLNGAIEFYNAQGACAKITIGLNRSTD